MEVAAFATLTPGAPAEADLCYRGFPAPRQIDGHPFVVGR
jgi:hypothetical protein